MQLKPATVKGFINFCFNMKLFVVQSFFPIILGVS